MLRFVVNSGVSVVFSVCKIWTNSIKASETTMFRLFAMTGQSKHSWRYPASYKQNDPASKPRTRVAPRRTRTASPRESVRIQMRRLPDATETTVIEALGEESPWAPQRIDLDVIQVRSPGIVSFVAATQTHGKAECQGLLRFPSTRRPSNEACHVRSSLKSP